jgi:peptidoglycan/LPS O-acetylase OafA/YrhL
MKKFLHFEGLRGIAAFIVFMAHFRPTFCSGIEQKFLDFMQITGIKSRALAENIMGILYTGELPVYIFWFMSAYVISIKLFDLKRNADNKYLIEASTKRYIRLGVPVFFSSLLCYILMKTNQIHNSELAEHLGKNYSDGWLNMWYHFNPSFIHFLKTSTIEVFMPGNSNYNMVLWTMNPELLGSFLCFGMFAVLGKNEKRFLIYILALLFLFIGGLRDNHYFYYIPFVCGIAWCDVIHSSDENVYLKNTILKIYESKLTPLILLCMAYGVTIFSDVFRPMPKNLYLFFSLPVKAIGFTLLVNNFTSIKRLFSTKVFTFMGKISFSFYLIHIPIMFSIGASLYLYAGIDDQYKLPVMFFSLTAINIVLSWMFMKLVDNKAISLSDKVGKYFSAFQRKND